MTAAHVLQAHVVEPGGEARPVAVAHQADEPLQVTQVLPVQRHVVFKSVFQIHEILARIRLRILGSVPLTKGFVSGSFLQLFLRLSKNLCLFLLKVHLHHSSKIKSRNRRIWIRSRICTTDPDPGPGGGLNPYRLYGSGSSSGSGTLLQILSSAINLLSYTYESKDY